MLCSVGKATRKGTKAGESTVDFALFAWLTMPYLEGCPQDLKDHV